MGSRRGSYAVLSLAAFIVCLGPMAAVRISQSSASRKDGESSRSDPSLIRFFYAPCTFFPAPRCFAPLQ